MRPQPTICPRPRRRRTGLWLLLVSALPLTAVAQPSNDYLKAINEEGSRLESLGKAREERAKLEKRMAKAAPAAKPPAKAPEKALAAAAQPAEDRGAFERRLQTEFPGSYALYSMLATDEKSQIFDEYQKSNAEGASRFFPVVNKIIAMSTRKR